MERKNTVTPESTLQEIRRRAPEEATKGWVWTMPGGRLKVYTETLGAVSTYFFPKTTQNKRWVIYGGYIERDVNATLALSVLDENSKIILTSDAVAAGTQNQGFGIMGTDALKWNFPLVLKPGWTIKITWGAAQTSPEVAIVYLEVDLE